MASDDIVIGADASQALREMQSLTNSFLEAAKAAGATNKQVAAMGTGLERAMATAAGAAVKSASTQAKASESVTKSLKAQAQAQAELSAEQKKNAAAAGANVTSNNRFTDAKSGQFISGTQVAQAQAYLASLEKVKSAQTLIANAPTMGTQQILAVQAMRKNIEALNIPATSLRSVMSSLAVSMRDIPPVAMAQKLAGITASFSTMSNSARYALYSVSAGAGIAGAAILGFGVLAVKAATDHERAFADVARTTQTTAAGYEALRLALQGMAMELPVAYSEITKIAAAAGQLGIQASGVENFTKTVAMLSATTNLSSEAAGNALARFKAFFSQASDPSLAVSEATFSNLASSILRVGINSIATESGIVNVATQISSMGKYAGLTANQVNGLSGAPSGHGAGV